MNPTTRRAAAAAGLMLTATVLAAGVPGPAVAAGKKAALPAAGAFTVADATFGPPQDVEGGKCELTVHGTLVFTGDLAGSAVGTTTALVFATCEEALAAAPGSYFDVFRFEGDFTGTVHGEAAEGTLVYAGVTQEGGLIDARIRLRGDDAWARLRTTDAVVLQGGTYTGKAKKPTA